MYKAFLIKYAEIAIKGKNRYIFEDTLVAQIKKYQLRNVEGNSVLPRNQDVSSCIQRANLTRRGY